MLRTQTMLAACVTFLASSFILIAEEPELLPNPRETKAEDAKATEPPKENPKLTKLKQLSYDRRPSNILKVWNEVQSPPRPKAKSDAPKVESIPTPSPEMIGGGPNPTAKADANPDPIDEEIKAFQIDVILSRWDRVKTFLVNFPEKEREPAYTAFLAGLQRPVLPGMPPIRDTGDPNEIMRAQMEMQQRQQIPPNLQEQNTFSVDDILGIASAAPIPIEDKHLKVIGLLLGRALSMGLSVLEEAIEKFTALAQKPAGQSPLTQRQFAKLMVNANQAASANRFLPTLEEAKKSQDAEALNLLAQHFLVKQAENGKMIELENAWIATQEILSIAKVDYEIMEESLKRAVSLAPRLKESFGQAWLEESFTKRIDRGREILATLGSRTTGGIQLMPGQPQQRLGELKLQKLAVESLLKGAPERAKEWETILTLIAAGWVREADCSRQYDRSLSLGPRMRFDPFGNIYYVNDDEEISPFQRMQPQPMVQAIRIGDLLEAMPNEAWLKSVEEGFRPKLAQAAAQVYLKVKEEARAFPYIEQLALKHPDKAKTLVNEFLRVWTRNHNLNSQRQTQNPFIYYYGFQRQAQGIPLTRSKQERNLVELAEWVAKLKKLPIGEIDQDLLASAFTSSHSSAEVYRLEVIESVFGPLKSIKPRTLSGLIQQMRENLAGLWRDQNVQQDNKTNRKQKDIQQEVLRGYKLARTVIDDALKQFPNDWSLNLAQASLIHDELNFQADLAKSSDFAPRRDEAMKLYARAAQFYVDIAKTLPEEEQSLQVFEQWFYASLGAVDVQYINEDKLSDQRQPEKIKAALAAIPGEIGERHLSRFANGLFTRMSGVKPAAKFRYLKAGFDIVGDHKQAWEAKKLYEFYKDLVTEIKLEAVVDGSTRVGHSEPFGVFVNIRHTREIERESGGFSRYLQNQNSGRGYFYNYGRPTTDYRDRFQNAVKDALGEQFEIVSVTFQDEKVNSRATTEYGWRFTPYAYLLIKPKGPQIDRIPPVRLDFDFLDTSGYVVLPVTTSTVPIDASSAKGEPRPMKKVQVTQILDERQADKGKLVLEVKATGVGLIRDLESLVELAPKGFQQKEVQTQPLSITRFDPEAELAINSERSWLVHYEAKPGEMPNEFTFGKPIGDEIEMALQRYDDADIVNATETQPLLASYGKTNSWGLILGIIGGVLVLLVIIGSILVLRKQKPVSTSGYRLPEKLDVFHVLGLLNRLRAESHLSESQYQEIEQTVQTLERSYFAPERNGSTPSDLKIIAEKWIRVVST